MIAWILKKNFDEDSIAIKSVATKSHFSGIMAGTDGIYAQFYPYA